jgi:outer membrane protein assembly factor BamB|uniref:outer membrane protein assembly factor BamB family protein n=1 Tax=Prosthecobacter sp. TaxID=1965333 RepID=UPI003783DBD8
MKLPVCLLLLLSTAAHAADWPMWRYDAGRTAASSEKLPAKLQLEWERLYSPREQVWDDPLNHDLMPYDKVFEPVVMGDRMFIGFNDRDKVVALDLSTGAEVWTFFTGGPVRLPPVCWQGKVYITSDDGHLYCLNADDGKAVWSFSGAPSARKALGNNRLISAWPARGGPVIREGKVYFAASIWPFMGTFLYSLDAETGKVVWVNDGTGADFIKQPHSASSFAGVAPQGALVATKDTLLVPGGRSVPAGFDLATGALRYFHLNDGGKGNGGSFVAAGDNYFYVHTRERGVRVYDLKTGTQGKSVMNEPVIDGSRLFDSDADKVRELGTSEKVLWEVKADGSGDLIKAGDHLYAAGKSSLSSIALGEKPRVAWTLPVKGEVLRLLAANGKLIAVTQDGRIQVYGSGKNLGSLASKPQKLATAPAEASKLAQALLERAGDKGGHALIFGASETGLLDALLSDSQMQITVVEKDEVKVDALRRQYDALGLQGTRISFHVGDALSFQAPPYFAHLVITTRQHLAAAYASVRPYGGVMLCDEAADVSTLENAKLEKLGAHQLIIREGALPGAADWTHQYGDIGNTVKSDDSRVRAPLGVLWFGGSSNMDVLPRHGHGPPEQVVGGRLYIQGMSSFSARDVYTGRVIWKHDFEDLGTFGIYYNETYEDTPLSTAYNQKHIPGANGRGTNYAATQEAVYVALKGDCQMLDAQTGELKKTIKLREDAKDPAQWAFIGVLDDLLIGGDDFAHFSLQTGNAKSRAAAPIEDYSASAGLAVFDRHSGKLLWRVKARHSFLHNGIVAGNGRIYCLDKLTKHAEGLLERRGKDLPKDYRIVALDARTGKVLWEQEKDLFGTWLGYSKKHDVLLQAGAKASDRLSTEVGDGMIAYEGKTGRVRWQDLKRAYTGPCILHNELILTGANSYTSSGGAFSLLTGDPHLVKNPLTGNMEPWRLNRTYGCNTIIASEHLLTYRSGAAGFYDLDSMSGTSNLGGFKSGCTSNLVVANGVLNAPDYTRTCSCSYQNQTSLALIHMPEMEMWSYSQFGLDGKQGDRILHAGINFGAPGNRRAPDGTLWIEHPHVGDGNAPQLGVEGIGKDVTWFRRHSTQIADAGKSQPWIIASGLIGEGEIVITPSLRRPLLVKPVKKSDDDDDKPSGKKKTTEKPKAVIVPTQEPLLKVDYPPLAHTVRLHFSDPDQLPPGERVFNVLLQGKAVLKNFDLAKEGGSAVREFKGIVIGKDLRLTLQSAHGSKAKPVLSGVEFVAESR